MPGLLFNERPFRRPSSQPPLRLVCTIELEGGIKRVAARSSRWHWRLNWVIFTTLPAKKWSSSTEPQLRATIKVTHVLFYALLADPRADEHEQGEIASWLETNELHTGYVQVGDQVLRRLASHHFRDDEADFLQNPIPT